MATCSKQTGVPLETSSKPAIVKLPRWHSTPGQLAKLIAAELFTNGMGETADRLVMEVKGKDRGGYCRAAVEQIILDNLTPIARDAERLRFIEAYHVKGGSLGRARTWREAIDAKMKHFQWKESEAANERARTTA